MSEDTLGPLVKKKLFGGYEVPLGPCISTVSTLLFQKGAILGRARFDRLNVVAKLMTNPGREDSLCSKLRELARKRLEDFGKKPDSFHTFWWETEFSTLDFNYFMSIKKVPLEEIFSLVNHWLMSGIGFGATYPDLVKEMWIKTYETPEDQDEWARAREYGLDIPEEQNLLPLDDMEQNVLLEVSRYVYEYFPQLMEPLNLKIT
ncbi:MAG: hypothetical protein ACYS3S_20595 [Planctomycetota bacterium]